MVDKVNLYTNNNCCNHDVFHLNYEKYDNNSKNIEIKVSSPQVLDVIPELIQCINIKQQNEKQHAVTNRTTNTERFKLISSEDQIEAKIYIPFNEIFAQQFFELYTIKFEDHNISGWNVGRISNMKNIFQGVSKFNIDISKWSTGEVTTTAGIFSTFLKKAQYISQNEQKDFHNVLIESIFV